MKIENIKIENFRNIESLQAEFDDNNIIFGENAQGKTNLLEAIYLFCGAKSFRKNKDKELIAFNKEYSKLEIEFFGKNRPQTAQLIIKEHRTAELNGIKKKSPSALSEEIKVIIFSPDHLAMIKSGPEERRKFIDSALCQIKNGYRNVLKEYNRSLLQRNVLLKKISERKIQRDTLEIWNENLAATGAKIIYQRKKYIEAITPYVSEIFEGLSNKNEKIDIQVKNGIKEDTDDINEIKKELINQLEEETEKDILFGRTNSGAHRYDIDILINEKNAKQFGSQGQQRSCVLALKLAEAELLSKMTGEKPIALLDDVMSELDEKRQEYILNNIKAGQVFITCCDASPILKLKEGKVFEIKKGKIV